MAHDQGGGYTKIYKGKMAKNRADVMLLQTDTDSSKQTISVTASMYSLPIHLSRCVVQNESSQIQENSLPTQWRSAVWASQLHPHGTKLSFSYYIPSYLFTALADNFER